MLFETTKSLKRILYIDPIKGNDITNIETIFFEEGVLFGHVAYSYSFDDIHWSDYYNKQDLITYLEGEETHALTTFLRVLLTVDVKPNTTFSTAVYNFVGIEEIKINGINVGVCGIEYHKDVNLVRNDDNSNRYNPYRGINDSHHLREQLSESIIDTFGISSTYFRRVPQENTKSIIWKSYKLHDTLDPKEIKVMLSIDDEYNGDVQSYQYYADYENLEVEITKETWKKTFGETLPTPKDCLYISLFEKMFRVVQVKEDRNFMNRAVAYKFYLGKHIEGVEIDNNTAQDNINDFTEFLAFDLENSDDAIDESENATGIQDTVEFTKEDRDTISHNENSTLIDYSKGMENIETKLEYLGNTFQRYMYYDSRKGVEFLAKYDISDYTEKTYTAQLWSKVLDVGKSIKVMRLETNGIFNETVYINANGLLAVNIKADEYNKYITAVGKPITPNNYYGISFSRSGQTVILSVVEHLGNVVNVIQEIVVTGIKRPVPNKTLTILADKNIMSGNIRFSKKPLSKKTIIQDITRYQPDSNDYIVIDNNNPTVTGLKVNNTY